MAGESARIAALRDRLREGLGDAHARSAIRISLGRTTSAADIDYLLLQLRLALH